MADHSCCARLGGSTKHYSPSLTVRRRQEPIVLPFNHSVIQSFSHSVIQSVDNRKDRSKKNNLTPNSKSKWRGNREERGKRSAVDGASSRPSDWLRYSHPSLTEVSPLPASGHLMSHSHGVYPSPLHLHPPATMTFLLGPDLTIWKM